MWLNQVSKCGGSHHNDEEFIGMHSVLMVLINNIHMKTSPPVICEPC